MIKNRIEESIRVKQLIANDPLLIDSIKHVADVLISTLKNGGKIVLCGNGGSASDAMHFAGEIVGKFQKERRSWPAIVLNSDPVAMSSIANDYDYSEVFYRQVDAFVHEKDVLMGISTSGNSENVYKAVKAAKDKKACTIGLLGKTGGEISEIVDISIIVPSDITARIQESHIMIIHILCELIEEALTADE